MTLQNADENKTQNIFNKPLKLLPSIILCNTQTAKDALCTNVDKQGVPHAGCFVPSWPSTGDLFVKGQNGPVDAVSFSLDAELVPKTDVRINLNSVTKRT